MEIDKRAFTSDSDDTFALPGATLTVTDWNGNVVDSWESSDTAHVICGLHLSHDFAGNRDTSKVYTLAETCPADGYTTARSIQFRLEQATDDNAYLQETAVWVLHESEDTAYQSGSIISPTAFSDDTVATISAKLHAFWDKLLGKNPDADGVVISNWYCVNGTLVVNFTDAANDRSIAKGLRESDFSDLTFDKVCLNGAAAPAFFADKQVAEKPADAEITYSASWILLKDSDGFSQTVTMLDAPTHVKISKADITTHEEIPGATLRVLDKDGNVVDEWVSEDAPHYMEAVLVAGETYTLEETLVPDGSGYIPANAIQFTVEDDGKVQHVFMQDDYTKVQISKTDIATGKEISGAKLKITDTDGKTIAEWVTDGTPHYMERIPMGTYTLTETMAPTEQGYVRAERVTFEVGPTGDIQRVEMKDDFTKVEISKADMTDGRELPGAKLKITDASGNTIAEWETTGQPHRIERLKPGDYTLTETAAPAGYLLSEEVHFTVQETGEIQKVTMYDAPAHSLILTKRDIATNAKLADARLTIRDAYGTTIDRWTTTDGDHAIRVLPERSAAKDPHKNLLLLSDDTSEHVYTMVEELAPNGYLVGIGIHVLHKDGVCHLSGCFDLPPQQAGTAAYENHSSRAQVKLTLAQCTQHIIDKLLRLIFHQRGDFFPVTASLPLQENSIHIRFLQQNIQVRARLGADTVVQQDHAIFQRVTGRQVGVAVLQHQIVRCKASHVQNQRARHGCQLAQHHGRRCKRLRIALHIADQDAVQLVTVGEVDGLL